MAKHYIVRITEIDEETGETKELLDEEESNYKSIILSGECLDGERCSEILINTNLMKIASLLVSGRKLSIATRLAMVALRAKDEQSTGLEDLLSAEIEGGAQ